MRTDQGIKRILYLTLWQVGAGLTLAVALVVAGGRVYIRIRQNHQAQLDDGLHFLAVVTLIAGTAIVYIDIPYIYLQESVESGARDPPPDLIQQLIKSVKIQDSAIVLLSTTVFMVKMSFLFFFYNLLRRLKKMMIWWWCVIAITVPSTLVLICSNFISCSYFDERILGGCSTGLSQGSKHAYCLTNGLAECVSPSALARENATLKSVAILDLLTDFLSTCPLQV